VYAKEAEHRVCDVRCRASVEQGPVEAAGHHVGGSFNNWIALSFSVMPDCEFECINWCMRLLSKISALKRYVTTHALLSSCEDNNDIISPKMGD
jgi:hypothetical protein